MDVSICFFLLVMTLFILASCLIAILTVLLWYAVMDEDVIQSIRIKILRYLNKNK